MYIIKTLPEFDKWIAGIKDRSTRVRLSRRVDRAQFGNFGDVRPVGSAVFEMREFFGSGWRMYYTLRGNTIVIMLAGGDKSSQSRDIAKAIELAAIIEE